METYYLDASALVKLVVAEAESGALRSLVVDARRTSSTVAAVEVALAARRRGGAGASERAGDVMRTVEKIELVEPIVQRAGRLAGLRALDAIHLASALEVAGDVEALVTYDHRLAAAATAAGVPVLSPGS